MDNLIQPQCQSSQMTMEFFKICNQKFRNKIDLWGRADKQIDADIEALAQGLKSKTYFFDQHRDNFEIVVSELVFGTTFEQDINDY